jgi:Phytanoyl-CoA dioxygenase (PhyH)
VNEYIANELRLLGDIVEFCKIKDEFFAKQPVLPAHESVKDYVSNLNRDGMVVIPNFLTQEQCQRLIKSQPDDTKFMASPEGDESKFYLNANANPAFSAFFDDARIPRIMKGYIGENTVPLRQSMEVRTKKGAVHAFNRMFHMDSWKPRVKAFLYLHDVAEGDAPLCYLKGSHKGHWRLPMEYRMHKQYQAGDNGYSKDLDVVWVGCYWPYEVANFKSENDLEEVVCMGKAGTLVVFDARGLHKATELVSDSRKILISHYIAEGHNT